MERDFLGINGKDSGGLLKEEGRGSSQDSAFLGSSKVQWPFSNKISALQQFMSFRAAQEGKPKKIVFDHLASSGFQPLATVDAFEASQKASSTSQVPQKCFSFDRQGGHQFSMHVYQPQGTNSFGSPTHHIKEARVFPVVSHHSDSADMSSPFFKVHGASNGPILPVTTLKTQPFGGGIVANNAAVVGSGVGDFAPGNASKPATATAQLTIFYAGSVNVYDDVPFDKAQAIMFLASKGCNEKPNVMNPRREAPILALPKVAGTDSLSLDQTKTKNTSNVAPSCSGLSATISVTSHASRSGSSTPDDMAGAKNVGPLPPLSHNEPPKAPSVAVTTAVGSAAAAPVLPRAVPQARKASLARFLEKRKERVTTAMPYPCPKNSPENKTGFEGANMAGKCPSDDISLSSNRESSWCLGRQNKNITDSGESPSTKLEM